MLEKAGAISRAAVSPRYILLQNLTGPRRAGNGGSSLPSGSFGARLRYLRTVKGLSQADVASCLGVSKPAISGWEKGRTRPKNARLGALADLLGVSQFDLMEEPQPVAYGDVIARSRIQIAQKLGVELNKVRIIIEF
ncbi:MULTISPECIES: helix-turn-helix transcriptional regulator [unclassified Sphingopyxis]|uniref:helix-turn-helix domain-containing protein n=1 Tax=unclassified Sphingopyxis TaxID=2614943 RepID=UPI00286A5D21|nr:MULTISPECIES: helix-turn-helix transcriptional regulator [unclassified Sphingopyxis]